MPVSVSVAAMVSASRGGAAMAAISRRPGSRVCKAGRMTAQSVIGTMRWLRRPWKPISMRP